MDGLPRALPHAQESACEQAAPTYAAAAAMYRAGDVGSASNLLPMNFLMDRSSKDWKAELLRLKQEVGDCDTRVPVPQQPVDRPSVLAQGCRRPPGSRLPKI